jgi:hypothetical protein
MNKPVSAAASVGLTLRVGVRETLNAFDALNSHDRQLRH